MQAAKSYLRLSTAYCDYLGGVRWSSREDALEYPDGTTFAFTEEVAQFLEGLASGGRLLPFAYVLHLLDLLRSAPRTVAPGIVRLCRAFADAGRPLRNAGAFCAVLCRELPEAAGPVEVQEVLDRLRNQGMPIRWYIVSFHDTFFPAEVPPLEPAAFEQYVADRLAAYRRDELDQWLRHGRGPVRGAAEALARELPLPRTLSGALASLLDRPRLAGARPFVSQLVSALTLPQRRLAPPEMPVGGYTDVTTHGRPDQILPGQLALDEWDFLRRYADHELLYFRREEPHARTEHELVVLLDQGVRTWGDVRLVLSAAVLALGRQAERSRLPFFLAATSRSGEVFDPLRLDGQALGSLVEASDLTANPGLALEHVLEQPGRPGRDVVLLTHPRALGEEDVRAAARRAPADTRLFALALDGGGRAELSELRHGAPVAVRQFRVDLSGPGPARPAARESVPVAGPWAGQVEPVPFPFRFGPGGPLLPNLLAFDHAGRWLLTVSGQGMLHAWPTVGGGVEVLPRGMLDGKLLTEPEAVVGVVGGFVVGGRLGGRLAVFHYNFRRRTCHGQFLDGLPAGGERYGLAYSPRHHCLIVHRGGSGWSLDLGTGILHVQTDRLHNPAPEAAAGPGVSLRARAGWSAWARGEVPPRRLEVLASPARGIAPACFLDGGTGEIRLYGLTPPWERFVPLADGRPRLKGGCAVNAQCGGTTLALKVVALGDKGGSSLHLFRGPPGVSVGEYPMASKGLGFVLSADGELLARQTAAWRVDVRWVTGDRPGFKTRAGGFSPPLKLWLSGARLGLLTGRHHAHMLRWDRGPLEMEHARSSHVPRAGWPHFAVTGTPEDVPTALRYDPKRFVAAAWSEVLAVADRFGQVVILDSRLELVCMFFAFRDRLAGWLPDGTCFGPGALTGQPPAPDALAKFGEALRRASGKGRVRP
jgi:hypothetical protein